MLDGSWRLFAALLLAPDLSMIACRRGLALGYGLKLQAAFADTHMGRIGKD